MNYREDVWKLLRRNISVGQMLGYGIANIVGLSVVLIGILFYTDSRHSSGDEDSFFSNDYIVLSKKVEGIGFNPINFSDEEIEDLESQKWVKKIGRFTSSQFAVNGSVNMGGKGLSTYLFFESVPDEFFDIKPKDWDFDPEEGFVPVILNKDYLALYNYGFAVPQRLPHLSEEIIGAIPITLRLTGQNSRPEFFDASIVGFSSRLNTIAVPQSFMDWANERYAPGMKTNPSRLIVEVDRMRAENMDEYLRQNDIEMSGNNQDAGNVSSFLAIVSSVVTANGVVICALAMFILILSIFLMLQKSRATLRNLMLLGYSPNEIASYYNIVIVVTNCVISAIALAITLSLRGLWNDSLQEIGIGGGSVLPTIVALCAYLLFCTALDLYVVRRHLKRLT